jgi:hypothetical protein
MPLPTAATDVPADVFPTEADLETSALFIGPDLEGYRLTEVRLWAACRDGEDVDASRDSYLPLASKRKRVQLGVKVSISSSSTSRFSLSCPSPKSAT